MRGDSHAFFERVRWKLSALMETAPRSVINRLAPENASLLHAHFGVDAIAAWPIAKALKIPMLVTLHGYDITIDRQWWEAGHGGRSMRHYPSQLLKLALEPGVRFIAVSGAIRQQAISRGIADDKIWVSYIGIDPTKFAPRGLPIIERGRRVLFIGRLVEKKGCHYLIKAFSKVQQEIPDASLTIIGDGHLRSDLQQLARNLSVRADFRGAVSNDEVILQLQDSRVFCLPSVRAANGDSEGLPIVLLEAQASGVPVVTSAISGGAEGVCEGITGLRFNQRDVETLATQLIYLLTEDSVAASMALAGPCFIADKFDFFRCTERLENLYDAMPSLSLA